MLHQFISVFHDTLNVNGLCSKCCYIVGDFNINILEIETDSDISDFLNTIYTFSLLPLIDKPTRITHSSATLIHNIITNDRNHHSSSGIIVSDISDHFPIYSLFENCRSNDTNYSSHNYHRDTSEENITNLISLLYQVDWSVLSTHNVDDAYSTFIEIYNSAFDRSCPLVKTRLKRGRSYTPWITNILLKSIRKKNQLYKKFMLKPNPANKLAYTSYRNMFSLVPLGMQRSCIMIRSLITTKAM